VEGVGTGVGGPAEDEEAQTMECPGVLKTLTLSETSQVKFIADLCSRLMFPV
jgi:hypothetical protein